MGVSTEATPLLHASELYRFFHAGDDETFALRGVSVSVSAGEIVAVVGPSGSGKSTLLSCLAGLDEPDGGHVTVAGQRITRRQEATRAGLRARWIGMLMQTNNLVNHLTVTQNIQAAQSLVKRGAAPRQVPAALLADEPTGEVDREAQARILDLLRQRASNGKAVLVVTHSRDVAAAADRTIHIVDGRITNE